MYKNQRPDLSELPSSGQLLRSTLIALIAAGVLLVTVVMPAEYAIDPTGAGRLLGLTQMGELKRSEEHTSELQSLMRISYAVFCLKKKTINITTNIIGNMTMNHIKTN